MLIKYRGAHHVTENDVTPQDTYLKRRTFIAGAAAAGLLPGAAAQAKGKARALNPLETVAWPGSTDEKQTPRDQVTSYNNYYEFGTDKADPAKNAHSLMTEPWSVNITGAVAKPFDGPHRQILRILQTGLKPARDAMPAPTT